jgi:hypothetical protein
MLAFFFVPFVYLKIDKISIVCCVLFNFTRFCAPQTPHLRFFSSPVVFAGRTRRVRAMCVPQTVVAVLSVALLLGALPGSFAQQIALVKSQPTVTQQPTTLFKVNVDSTVGSEYVALCVVERVSRANLLRFSSLHRCLVLQVLVLHARASVGKRDRSDSDRCVSVWTAR